MLPGWEAARRSPSHGSSVNEAPVPLAVAAEAVPDNIEAPCTDHCEAGEAATVISQLPKVQNDADKQHGYYKIHIN